MNVVMQLRVVIATLGGKQAVVQLSTPALRTSTTQTHASYDLRRWDAFTSSTAADKLRDMLRNISKDLSYTLEMRFGQFPPHIAKHNRLTFLNKLNWIGNFSFT